MFKSQHFERVGRNKLCPCGSGKKYKNCCIGRKNKAPFPFAIVANLYRFFLSRVGRFIRIGDTNRSPSSTRLMFLGGWPNQIVAAILTFMTIVLGFIFVWWFVFIVLSIFL